MVEELVNSVSQWWGEMGSQQRWLLIGGVGVAVVGTGAFVVHRMMRK